MIDRRLMAIDGGGCHRSGGRSTLAAELGHRPCALEHQFGGGHLLLRRREPVACRARTRHPAVEFGDPRRQSGQPLLDIDGGHLVAVMPPTRPGQQLQVAFLVHGVGDRRGQRLRELTIGRRCRPHRHLIAGEQPEFEVVGGAGRRGPPLPPPDPRRPAGCSAAFRSSSVVFLAVAAATTAGVRPWRSISSRSRSICGRWSMSCDIRSLKPRHCRSLFARSLACSHVGCGGLPPAPGRLGGRGGHPRPVGEQIPQVREPHLIDVGRWVQLSSLGEPGRHLPDPFVAVPQTCAGIAAGQRRTTPRCVPNRPVSNSRSSRSPRSAVSARRNRAKSPCGSSTTWKNWSADIPSRSMTASPTSSALVRPSGAAAGRGARSSAGSPCPAAAWCRSRVLSGARTRGAG